MITNAQNGPLAVRVILTEAMVKFIDYYADWCGPCQMMAPVIGELEKELSGRVEFEKVNVDNDSDRAGRAGILSIPTYVIEKDGKEVDRLIGARGKEVFKKWIESHLSNPVDQKTPASSH